MADAAENLLPAATLGDLTAVRSALAAGADVNSRREYGDAALNLAAANGHGAIVLTLVGAGASIENLGDADKTPLMNAAFAGHVDVVQMLLAAGCAHQRRPSPRPFHEGQCFGRERRARHGAD